MVFNIRSNLFSKNVTHVFVWYSYVCVVYVYLCIYVYVCPHAHVCGIQKLMFGAFLGCFPPLFFDRVSHWVLTHLSKWRVRELCRPVGSGSSHCDHAYILVWDLVIPTHTPMLVLQPLFQQSHLPSSSHKHCVSLVYDPFVIFPWEIWLSDFDCHCLALTEEQETHFLTKWCSDLNNFQPVSKSYFLKVEIIII